MVDVKSPVVLPTEATAMAVHIRDELAVLRQRYNRVFIASEQTVQQITTELSRADFSQLMQSIRPPFIDDIESVPNMYELQYVSATGTANTSKAGSLSLVMIGEQKAGAPALQATPLFSRKKAVAPKGAELLRTLVSLQQQHRSLIECDLKLFHDITDPTHELQSSDIHDWLAKAIATKPAEGGGTRTGTGTSTDMICHLEVDPQHFLRPKWQPIDYGDSPESNVPVLSMKHPSSTGIIVFCLSFAVAVFSVLILRLFR